MSPNYNDLNHLEPTQTELKEEDLFIKSQRVNVSHVGKIASGIFTKKQKLLFCAGFSFCALAML